VSKVVRKIAPIASIALPIAFPGLGTAIGAALGAGAAAAPIVGSAALGAGLGAASGGGLKGAALGGVTGGLAGGGGNLIAGSAGLTGTAQSALGSAIAGGVGGAASGGGLEGALLGAAVGGATPYVRNALAPTATMSSNGIPIPTTKPLQTQSANLTIGGQPVKLGSLLSAGSDIYGYMQGQNDLEDMQDMYRQAQQQAQAQLNPYAQAGQTALQNIQAPNMEALMNDPAYQFQLQQGNQNLDRSLAARGLGQSGAALKAAQEFGQGLANQTYQQYFDRQALLAGQGQNAAAGLGSIIGQGANANAAAQAAMINNRNQALSNLFRQEDDGILTGSLGRLIGGFA
jgi:hypothetical protein